MSLSICQVYQVSPGAAVDTLILWGAGPTGRRFHRLFSAAGRRIAAVIDIDPFKIGKHLRGTPIVAADRLRELLTPNVPVLMCVAARGARGLIRSQLLDFGLEEGREFWCLS